MKFFKAINGITVWPIYSDKYILAKIDVYTGLLSRYYIEMVVGKI